MNFLKKIGGSSISKKIIINVVLLGLAWIVIIWGSKVYFNKYTHHGEGIEVPNLLNNNANDISALIGDKKLQYEILDSVYNPDLVEGTIIYQNPMPTDSTGLYVKADRTINLRVSKRSRLVSVPIVVSRSQRFAEAVLMTKGLRTKVKYVPSIEDQGSVISASYNGKAVAPGQKIPINSVIELTVGRRSQGDLIPVPNLTGLTISEAEARFEHDASLRLFPVCSGCETKSDSLKARIIRQTPVATDSSRIARGATITVFMSPSEDGMFD